MLVAVVGPLGFLGSRLDCDEGARAKQRGDGGGRPARVFSDDFAKLMTGGLSAMVEALVEWCRLWLGRWWWQLGARLSLVFSPYEMLLLVLD